MTKQESRAAARAAFETWAAADPEGPVKASRRIMERIEESVEFRDAGTVLVYMSIRGEVLTQASVDKWRASKRIALPLVKGKDLSLRLYDPPLLVEGYRGIIEPSDAAVEIDPAEIDLAIVPGAAFELKDGGKVLRLGRGGGFYDRLLPRLDCPKFGVCFSCRLIDGIPVDPWDIPLDRIFTEN